MCLVSRGIIRVAAPLKGARTTYIGLVSRGIIRVAAPLKGARTTYIGLVSRGSRAMSGITRF